MKSPEELDRQTAEINRIMDDVKHCALRRYQTERASWLAAESSRAAERIANKAKKDLAEAEERLHLAVRRASGAPVEWAESPVCYQHKID